MTAHIIFDIKIDDGFTSKEIFVTDGHKVDTPPSMSSASFIFRYNVWIVLMIAVLNSLYLKCTDLQN